MSLSIKNSKAHSLARELADLRHLPITDVVIDELSRGVARERKKRQAFNDPEERFRKVMEISERVARLPTLDPRHPDDILYDEHGLPK